LSALRFVPRSRYSRVRSAQKHFEDRDQLPQKRLSKETRLGIRGRTESQGEDRAEAKGSSGL
jgi:hypothetical protein